MLYFENISLNISNTFVPGINLTLTHIFVSAPPLGAEWEKAVQALEIAGYGQPC